MLISLGVLALRTSSCRPSVRAASCVSLIVCRGFRKLRVHQQGDESSIWNKFVQQPQAFSAQHGTEKADPCDVSARPVEACDEAGPDRVATEREDDRYRGGRRLGRQNRIAASGRGDHRHLAGDQIGRKCRQSILLVFRIAVFDRHVTAFDIAGFTQATAERNRKVGPIISSQAGQEPYHRHRRLLRARRERPRRRRAAEKRDELAPPHSITSSARASSVGGTSRPSALAVLQVDDQLELGRLQDRQVGWLLALEDATGIDAGLANQVGIARSVAHQPAGFGILAQRVDRGHRVARRQRGELHARLTNNGSRPTRSASARFCTRHRKGRVDVATCAGGEDFDLPPDGRAPPPARR